MSATYASFSRRQVEDQAAVTLGYSDGAIGVVETGFLSSDPFSIEIHGTSGSLAYHSTENSLRIRGAGSDGWQTLSVPPDEEDAFGRWVTHIRDRTRADDNLIRTAASLSPSIPWTPTPWRWRICELPALGHPSAAHREGGHRRTLPHPGRVRGCA